MMVRLMRTALIGSAAVLLSIPIFSAAQAAALTPVNWASETTPLTSYYDGQRVVTVWGTLFNEDCVYATNAMTLNDPSNDANSVYAKTHFRFWTGSTWQDGHTRSTGSYDYFNTPTTTWVRDSLATNGHKARGESYACAQMGWPVPVSCTDNHAYPTFNY